MAALGHGAVCCHHSASLNRPVGVYDGLGLGSFLAGRYVRSRTDRLPSLRLYALVELLIGVSALAVPRELAFGRAFLERLDAGHPLSLSLYYILAGLWIGITLVPWCACMGATFPFAMAAIRESGSAASPRSFSYLYLANVLGAVAGTAIPLLLIERRGFQVTLHVGAVLNLCLATSAFLLPLRQGKVADRKTASATSTSPTAPTNRWPYYVLFGTGLTSMAAEVGWIRLFPPSLGTMIYALAMILGLYMGATYLGSQFYRRLKSTQQGVTGLLFALLAVLIEEILPPLIVRPPHQPHNMPAGV
jgi:spermidine synthase